MPLNQTTSTFLMLNTNLKIDLEEDKEIDLEGKEVKEEMITVDSTTTTLEI